MSGITFNQYAFDRRDNKTGRWKCRICEKPATPPKIYYCSDECRTLFNRATSWEYTRYLVFKRDNGKCVKCGNTLTRNCSWYDYKDREWKFSDEVAEIHHVIPEAYLWNEIFLALEGLEGAEREYRKEQLKSIVLFHIDNLVTLCEDCHKEAHRSGWYEKYRFMETGQQTLDQVAISEITNKSEASDV